MTFATGHPIALIVLAIEVLFFGYFLVSNAAYLMTTIIALIRLPSFVKLQHIRSIKPSTSALAFPVSVLVPAYNEAEGILDTVNSLLNLDYSEYEVIVINDGSKDRTLELLQETFALEPHAEAWPITLRTSPSAPVRTIYRSRTFPRLRVIDKENGGKANALNDAVNAARYPLILTCDGDSYYSADALQHLIQPFVSDPTTVLVGGGIGVSNDCEFRNGALNRVRLSRNWLVRFQVVEYLRSFLSSRTGWAPLNGLVSISGACSLYRKEVVIQAGGFRTDTIWEDMEMTIRVHHMLRRQRRPYRIAFTPFNVCWTQVPNSVRAFWNQRVGWHRHLSECVAIHRRLACHPSGGPVGFIAFPYLIVVEWIAPLVVVSGLAFGFAVAALGWLSFSSQYALLALVLALELLVSAAALLLDVLSFNTYDTRELLILIVAAVLEPLGFRQLACLANLGGFCAWLFARPIRGRREVPSWNVQAYEPPRPR